MRLNVIYFCVLLLTSCKGIFNKDYRGHSYFKLKTGSIELVQKTSSTEDISKCEAQYTRYGLPSRKNKAYQFKYNYDLLDKTKPLSFLITFEVDVYFWNLYDFYPGHGSAEKIVSLDVYLKNKDSLFLINKYNLTDSLSDYQWWTIDSTNSLATFFRDSIVNGFGCQNGPKCFTNSISDFVSKFNSEPELFGAIFENTFFFTFDQQLFKEITFSPDEIEVRFKMKLPSKRRERIVSIIKKI